MNDLSDYRCPVASQNRANAFVQVCKRDSVILFAGQNKQWGLIFLVTAFGPFLGKLGYENDRSHVWRVAIRINPQGRRQKHAIRIAALVSSAWAWRSDMRGNALGSHFDPIAPHEIVSVFGKLQPPKCRIDAHKPCPKGRSWLAFILEKYTTKESQSTF